MNIYKYKHVYEYVYKLMFGDVSYVFSHTQNRDLKAKYIIYVIYIHKYDKYYICRKRNLKGRSGIICK